MKLMPVIANVVSPNPAVKFQGVSIATAFMTKTSLQIKNKHEK
jgi:hypothetical protein